jgi:hypothetical protein
MAGEVLLSALTWALCETLLTEASGAGMGTDSSDMPMPFQLMAC